MDYTKSHNSDSLIKTAQNPWPTLYPSPVLSEFKGSPSTTTERSMESKSNNKIIWLGEINVMRLAYFLVVFFHYLSDCHKAKNKISHTIGGVNTIKMRPGCHCVSGCIPLMWGGRTVKNKAVWDPGMGRNYCQNCNLMASTTNRSCKAATVEFQTSLI